MARMKKPSIFKTIITETLQREIEIEADSEEEAIEITERKYKKCEVVLDESDYKGVEFSTSKYTRKEEEILKEISCFAKTTVENVIIAVKMSVYYLELKK